MCRVYLNLDQQLEGCTRTAPADPDTQEQGTVLTLRFGGYLLHGIITEHIHPHTELQKSKLSEVIPSVLFINELVFVVFSIEEGFSHIRRFQHISLTPWSDDPMKIPQLYKVMQAIKLCRKRTMSFSFRSYYCFHMRKRSGKLTHTTPNSPDQEYFWWPHSKFSLIFQ